MLRYLWYCYSKIVIFKSCTKKWCVFYFCIKYRNWQINMESTVFFPAKISHCFAHSCKRRDLCSLTARIAVLVIGNLILHYLLVNISSVGFVFILSEFTIIHIMQSLVSYLPCEAARLFWEGILRVLIKSMTWLVFFIKQCCLLEKVFITADILDIQPALSL